MAYGRRPTVRLSDLELFVAAVECATFDDAATRMGCHQSTVTNAVIRLETWLHFPLLSGDRPRELLPTGEEFLPIARQTIQLLNGARKDPTIVPPPPPHISGSDIKI
ncbi:LysR family transcriptional regulator [Altererythrobacter arenosus]|uniref:LysR family transcriptional regulator n=1 Tax=Altererythrobacter arenosus TaxID=3032592 RepID=UPI003D319530